MGSENDLSLLFVFFFFVFIFSAHRVNVLRPSFVFSSLFFFSFIWEEKTGTKETHTKRLLLFIRCKGKMLFFFASAFIFCLSKIKISRISCHRLLACGRIRPFLFQKMITWHYLRPFWREMLKVDRITSFQNENDVDKMEKKLKLISSSLEIIEEHNIFQLPNFTQLCALSPSFYGQHHFFVSSFCPRGFKYLAFIFIQGGKGVASRAGDNVQYFIVTFQVFVCLLRKGVRTSGQQLAVFCFVFRRPK